MFSDIEGYSAAMSEDEERALAMLDEHNAIVVPLVEDGGGTVVKFIGDAVLATYESAADAVTAAVAIQNALAERNREASGSAIAIRIGIHIGDVVLTENDAFGDGVNVAARIEGMAEPGGVAVSQTTYEMVRAQPGLRAVSLGPQKLKNIREPITIYKLLIGDEGGASSIPEAAARPARRIPRSRAVVIGLAAVAFGLVIVAITSLSGGRSPELPTSPAQASNLDRAVAVLPFSDLSPAGDQQYLADGVAEDILAQLSTIEELHVISRASVMRYRDTTKGLSQIGEELGVGRVLDGSIRRVGDDIRIVARLTDARTDRQLWAQTYDRELTDIFAVQSEIAAEIAAAMRVQLTAAAKQRVAQAEAANVEAYDLYLQGRALLYASFDSPEELARTLDEAIARFRQALELEPDYALAYAGLSEAYRIMGPISPDIAGRPEVEFARRAVKFGPGLPEGYIQLALAKEGSDPRAAIEHLNVALALDPNHAGARGAKGAIHLRAGRLARAALALERAAALDPGFADYARSLSEIYQLLGDHEAAVDWLERAFEIDPHPPRESTELARLALERGDLDAAAALASEVLDHAPDNMLALINSVHLYTRIGDFERARELRERARIYDAIFDEVPGELAANFLTVLAWLAESDGELEKAEAHLARAEARVREALERGPSAPDLFASLAMVLAHRGDTDGAIRALEEAVDRGWRGYYTTKNLRDFAPLAGDPRFEELMADVRSRVDEMRARLERERR